MGNYEMRVPLHGDVLTHGSPEAVCVCAVAPRVQVDAAASQ